MLGSGQSEVLFARTWSWVFEGRGKVGGVTATAFGLLIAYMLPGLTALYGLSFWSSAIERVLSILVTTESNAALFFLVLLIALIAGLFASLVRWLLLDLTLCRWLFAKERLLFAFTWKGSRRGLKCPALTRPSPSDYLHLGKGQILTAYRAFVEETYRYYQFWGATAIVMPIPIVGWLLSLSLTGLHTWLLGGALALVEIAVFAKAMESWVSVTLGHASILRGEDDGSKSEVEPPQKPSKGHGQEVNGEEEHGGSKEDYAGKEEHGQKVNGEEEHGGSEEDYAGKEEHGQAKSWQG
jgi:hypothetical protein